MLAKYDVNHATEALTWMGETIGESFNYSGEMENFQAQLKDGSKLCK